MFKLIDCPNGLYQWDINRKIKVEDKTIREVHFSNVNSKSAIVVEVKEGIVDIPNIILQNNLKMKVYASNGENIRFDDSFDIKARVKPQDYVYEENQIIKLEEIENRLNELENNAVNVYCWGDSLTQGIGGNVNGWHMISYPKVLSEYCNAINLGILSDDVPTIMSRIGAETITLPECVIPGSSKNSVIIGNTTDGLSLQSGRTAKLLKYGEAGVNPCFVNDVPCVLFRDYAEDTTDGLNIRLRRLNDGLPVEVEAGTVLQTFGSKFYKGNGLHIFWMGANGGYGSDVAGTDLAFSDYLNQLQKCVDYVSPADYLIVYARERKGYALDEESEIEELKSKFPNHVINLLPQLNDRGLLYAETNSWDGTKVNGVPSVLDSGDGCHYSFYGYMAIGKIIWEYIVQRLMNQNKEEIQPIEEDKDSIGVWAYKLKEAKTLVDGSAPINTYFKPFAEGNDYWTIAVKYSSDLQAATSDQWGSLLECEAITGKTQLRVATLDSNTLYPECNIMCNSGGFKIDIDSMNIQLYDKNYHTLIITKNVNQYSFYLDNNKLYGNSLGYPQDGYGDKDLFVGGWSSGWGMVKGTIFDIRIYNKCINDEEVTTLNNILETE